MSGPLSGIKVIEIAGIGPGPFCAMMLADMGADVLRVDRAGSVRDEPAERPSADLLNRGRRSVGVDLKHPEGVATILRLVDEADVLMEGFRPGVMERLGLGPDTCLERNPRLVYGRMTGFGQEGPLAQAAGHDINYISMAGALAHIGRAGEKPLPPLNLVGDFGGGGMLLAFGLVSALVERASSGKGQVVDAAMVDGAAVLMTMIHSFLGIGAWNNERGTNLLDTGAHFYDTYETKDGRYVSVGSIEPQFYAELLRLTGLEGQELPGQMDRAAWPEWRERLTGIFKSKTRDEWCEIMEGTDVCFAPVLTIEEAYEHPHNKLRETFVEVGGFRQPAPAPRFSRTPGDISGPSPHPGQHTDEGLGAWGLGPEDLSKLREAGAIK
ncbi:MAG: CaiB/BaiF CoA-transferase family protein [Planctomycetota bacterium]|jgi:alpha-methylacyl-CoA racemase|nr:carnitine dehydratase [Deltaproteobacteria bacterium]MDP6539864.1 CaiB/BaiF CoA-transferase family protein [Planctomycetota bacterium]